MTDRAPSSASPGPVPSGSPSPLEQHARLGGEGQQELREVGRGPRAIAGGLAAGGRRAAWALRDPGLSSASSRGRPSGVKCLRSLTVKGFSRLAHQRSPGRLQAAHERPASLLHRSAAGEILAQVALPSADAALLALPRRPHPDPLAVGRDAHRAVPVRPQDEGAGAPVALDDLGVRVAEGVVRAGRDDGQPGARAATRPLAAARPAAVVRHLQHERRAARAAVAPPRPRRPP